MIFVIFQVERETVMTFGKVEYKIKQKEKELEKLLSEEERSLNKTNIKRNRGELK